MPNKISAIVSALMALSYSLMGILLFIYPDSAFTERFLPDYKWAYYLGTLLIVYGIYRAWRMYQKFKDDDDDEEYEYYDGTKG
jgi:formate hydrogenlyase subunit 3/multisubunit Na+/H+ antiporter MnhD subunit